MMELFIFLLGVLVGVAGITGWTYLIIKSEKEREERGENEEV